MREVSREEAGYDSLDFIHAFDCSLRFSVVLETNETEASAAASVAVLNDDLWCRLVHHGPSRSELCTCAYRFLNNSEFFELRA